LSFQLSILKIVLIMNAIRNLVTRNALSDSIGVSISEKERKAVPYCERKKVTESDGWGSRKSQ